ncbi:tyrosine-type recombinase/integrase [Streptomyces sp. SID13666]|uniref:tyrosine-type recombinase/integrase n=1 Tax=unclassified Streptomyces TaxID=2593676 RepID=UPI0013C2828F|nr:MULTISPECIES: tyrosine-type recombinase/integrase [unclassified Streptomyces]NEA59411.1 tyrosine-type recombinase/integrase [Streptomyces sp. SID13666]NEA72469.1 tyrosine-type recombinase/integrase [Streptomyces sp. SID13588]
MGSIIKRCGCTITAWDGCDHPWVVRWREPGGRSGRQLEHTFEKGAAGKKLAEKWERKVERAKDLGSYIDPEKSKRTFADVWNEWVNAGKDEGELAKSSRVQYDSVYRNHYERPFGSRAIGAISASDITRWESSEKERKYKPYGIQVRKNILASVFKYAYEAEIIAKNPCKRADPRKRKIEDTYRAIDPSEVPEAWEVESIAEHIRAAFSSAVWGMAGTGMRPGEALGVCESKWDKEAGLYVADAQLTSFTANDGAGRGTGMKDELKWSRKGRTVPVADITAESWSTHIATFGTWGDPGWFYESEMYVGRHPARTTFGSHWGKAIDSAGLEDRNLTPKSLRHFFVSAAIAAGVPLAEVAAWVGHSSSKVTEKIYFHLIKGAEARAKGAIALALAQNLSDALDRRRGARRAE